MNVVLDTGQNLSAFIKLMSQAHEGERLLQASVISLKGKVIERSNFA